MVLRSLFRRPQSPTQAAVEGVLTVLLAAQLVIWTWVLASGTPRPVAAAVRVAGPVTAPASLAGDPFFRVAASDSAPEPYVLYAVRAGAGGGAILAGSDGVQRAVGIGEAAGEGVVLAAVAPDHVILARGPVRWRVDFPATPPTSQAAPITASTTVATSGSGAIGPEAADAAAYAAALRPVGGGAEGYVWRPGVPGGVLAAAGLRPGDVILKVNGTPFDRSERFEELASEVASGRVIDIEYSRNGGFFSVRYSPDQ